MRGGFTMLPFAAVVLLLLSVTRQAAGQDAASLTFNVCVLDNKPYASCQGLDPIDFTGYDVNVFETVLNKMGLGLSPNMSCYLSIEEILTAAGDGLCDVMIGGIPATPDNNLLEVVRYSWPIHRSGYRIVVPTGKETVNYWAFLRAFEWQLWLAIGLTIVFVVVLVCSIERWDFMGGGKYAEEPPESVQDKMFLTIGTSMMANEVLSKSFPASIILVGFTFLCMIINNMYTANSAADLTATRLSFKITGLKDLPGKAVGTYTGAEEDFVKYGITARAINYTGTLEEFYNVAFRALLSNEVEALILDATLVEYVSATRCDIALVGEEFLQMDNIFIFPRTVNEEFFDAFNGVIYGMYPSGEIEKLAKEYLKPAEAKCKEADTEGSTQIKFKQVAGLWFVLAGSIVIAIVLVLVFKLARRSAKKVAQTRRFQAGVSKLHRSMSRLGSGKLATLANFGRRGRGSGNDEEEESSSLPDDKGLNRSPPSELVGTHEGVDVQAVAAAAARQAVQEYHARMEQLLHTKI